ncbi:uncharacterized protein NECHADRAFT_88017 [Fusarium vanettenii 77-13-4]|uniref:Uncharacterized protein n=1 Tax=Fusarium vanettenii (strain ATCC MYA-4622 / CBS 123669 / FGSC 9596 / NRRL 45880 / 77-13-4) TaxID=660122 RepID=C7ZN89_FUSV7|nr:uncharacterized protein NECHADRAFT_88017 [Fusarium vanettenii 77-13-4]EEU34525.1 predicted protein [Fusarium vanettenii 77-13-4]
MQQSDDLRVGRCRVSCARVVHSGSDKLPSHLPGAGLSPLKEPPIPPTISASDSDTPQTPLLPPKSSSPDAPPTIPPLPSGSVDPPVQPPSPSDPPKTTSSEGPGLVTVTGTDSGVITYSPTRYTEYETATETRTTTRDDGLIIIIFPGGWSWIPFGIPDPNPPPPPPGPPTPGPDKPDPSTAKSSRCTLTKPPECTRTVSFISVGSGYSSTVYGECSYATSCATGEQSTTTTVVDVQGQADNEFGDPEEEWPAESGDPDQSSLDFFEAWYDELGISFDSIGNVEAECEGDEAQIDSMCLVRTVVDFCSEVNKDKDKELSIEIPSGGREEQKRSIVRRDVECDGWAFEFVWTGSGGGQCLDNCNGAMAEIIGQCAISDPFRVPEKGKIDAECGTYSYKIKPFTKPTSTSSKPAEPSKTDATPVPPQASNFKCNNPADFIGHIDVSESSVWDSAWSACHRDIAPAEWDTDESKKIGMFDQWEKEHGVGFRYSISWIEGCRVLPDNKQKLWHPEAFYHKYSPDCRLVFSDLWKYCNDNEGVGGAVDYGCIRYEMKAGV